MKYTAILTAALLSLLFFAGAVRADNTDILNFNFELSTNLKIPTNWTQYNQTGGTIAYARRHSDNAFGTQEGIFWYNTDGSHIGNTTSQFFGFANGTTNIKLRAEFDGGGTSSNEINVCDWTHQRDIDGFSLPIGCNDGEAATVSSLDGAADGLDKFRNGTVFTPDPTRQYYIAAMDKLGSQPVEVDDIHFVQDPTLTRIDVILEEFVDSDLGCNTFTEVEFKGFIRDVDNNPVQGNVSLYLENTFTHPHQTTNRLYHNESNGTGFFGLCVVPGVYEVLFRGQDLQPFVKAQHVIPLDTTFNINLVNYSVEVELRDFDTNQGIEDELIKLDDADGNNIDFNYTNSSGNTLLSADGGKQVATVYGLPTSYSTDTGLGEYVFNWSIGAPQVGSIFWTATAGNVTALLTAFDGLNYSNIPYATFKVFDGFNLVAVAVGYANGSVDVNLESNQTYQIVTSAAGYITNSNFYATVNVNNSVYEIPLIPEPDSVLYYTINGTVTKGGAVAPLEPVNYQCFSDYGNPAGFTATDGNGVYVIPSIPSGAYCEIRHFVQGTSLQNGLSDFTWTGTITSDTTVDIDVGDSAQFTFRFVEEGTDYVIPNLKILAYQNGTYFNTYYQQSDGLLIVIDDNKNITFRTRNNDLFYDGDFEFITNTTSGVLSATFELERIPWNLIDGCPQKFIIVPDTLDNVTFPKQLEFVITEINDNFTAAFIYNIGRLLELPVSNETWSFERNFTCGVNHKVTMRRDIDYSFTRRDFTAQLNQAPITLDVKVNNNAGPGLKEHTNLFSRILVSFMDAFGFDSDITFTELTFGLAGLAIAIILVLGMVRMVQVVT